MTDPATVEKPPAHVVAIRNAIHDAMCEAETSQMQRSYTKADWLACLAKAEKKVLAALAAHEQAIKDAGMVVVPFSDELPPEVIDAGAQRLASFGDDSIWPDSWEASQVTQMRVLAERVIRSALVAMIAASEGGEG